MRKRILALLVAGCSTAAIGKQPSWTISETSGAVRVSHAGITRVATRGNAIAPGDVVTTGPGGRAVLVRGTEFMMVAPASQLRLPVEEQATGFTRVFEDFGHVVFMIKKQMTPHFEVKTPYLAAVVKGTTFSIGVSPQGAAVQVLEGAVDVATGDGGAHDMLRPGSIARVGADNMYRMQVQTNGIMRTLVSPAMPASGDTAGPIVTAPSGTTAQDDSTTTPALATPALAAPTLATPPADQIAIAADAPGSASATPGVMAAVYETPVSLASTTAGLVTGTLGGNALADLADVASISRTVTEASTSAVKAVQVAVETTAVTDAQTVAASAATRQSEAATAAAESKASADRASEEAASAALRANDAAAKAKAAQDASEAAKMAAQAQADAAVKAAADASQQAAAAQADAAAKAAAKAAADADAAMAARAAEDAARAAADSSAEQAARVAAATAAKAAEDARRASELAAAADADHAAK